MSDDTPTDTEQADKGWFRSFLRDFFTDMTCGDWVEFVVYVFVGVGLLVMGIAWLIGRF